jgi:cell division protein FtsQ
MNKTLRISIIVIIVCIIAFLIYRTVNTHDESVCQGFKIEITNANKYAYVHPVELEHMVQSQYHHLEGTKMSEIELDRIREIIISNPFVSNAKVYKSLDLYITAEVEQREPLVRVFNMNGKAFMIDTSGDIMPVPVRQSLNLICAGGKIDIEPDSLKEANVHVFENSDNKSLKSLYSIFRLATILSADEHFSDLISQIYVNEEYELELIPTIGDFVIFFGQADYHEEKMQKLHIIYTRLLPYKDMSIYKNIDLSIKNQLILQKK